MRLTKAEAMVRRDIYRGKVQEYVKAGDSPRDAQRKALEDLNQYDQEQLINPASPTGGTEDR